jgi:transcriptional regulator with XRE-family HTH domain
MDNHGVILRQLRLINKYSIKEAAAKLEKSAGWLSEIENGNPRSRLNPPEFERIVALYVGEPYRKKFSLWIANKNRHPKTDDISFDGAILKYVRTKAHMTLFEASERAKISKRYLSNVENGFKSIRLEMRNRLMEIYGYSPASFKNFATEDKRAKSVPIRYKLNVLIKQLDEQKLTEILKYALALHGQQPIASAPNS